jgi:mRNA (guanine-N7-)-methyltransferase
MLVAKRRFGNYFQQFKDSGNDLLNRMNALETFPAPSGKPLVGQDREEENYAHAKRFVEGLAPDRPPRIGTLSKDEWEAATLYVIFAFKKMKLS